MELWAPTYNWLGAHLVGFRLKTNPHLFGDLLPNKLPVTVELSHFALRGLISSVFNIWSRQQHGKLFQRWIEDDVSCCYPSSLPFPVPFLNLIMYSPSNDFYDQYDKWFILRNQGDVGDVDVFCLHFCSFTLDPNTSWEGVFGIFGGVSKHLLLFGCHPGSVSRLSR